MEPPSTSAGPRSFWWVKILIDHDTEPTELFSGVTKILLGLFLIAPWSTFASAPKLYGDMAGVPESAWGALLVAVGVGHLFALRDGQIGWRRAAAFVSFLVWVSFGGTFIHTAPTAMIGWILIALSLWLGWVYIHLGIVARRPGVNGS
jgi:hypothetical protein